MCSSDRKNEKIDNLSSDNKRLRSERDNAEDTLHKEQRALRDSQQRADEKLSNMELLLATRDTALKMQERATEQLEEENTKAREKRAVMRLIDDLAAVAKRKYDDIGETPADDSDDRSIIPPQPPRRQTGATATSSSAETLPMLPSPQGFPTPVGVPTAMAPAMAPTSPVPVLPAASGIPAVNDGNFSPSSYSDDSDTEKPPDVDAPPALAADVVADAPPLAVAEKLEVAVPAELAR